MNVTSDSTYPASSAQYYDHNSLRQGSLKRKFDLLGPYVPYPSPPMSSPPSPSRTHQPESFIHSDRQTSPAGRTSDGPVTALPTLTTSLPTAPSVQPPLFFGQRSSHPALTTAPPAAVAHYGPIGNFSVDRPRPGSPGVPDTSSAAGPSTSMRGGRRSKTHVASACINCKRAHLSCDIQRPCARCVASGKQDSCVDVQHKKRGRPRLREEGEFRVEPTVLEDTAQAATSVGLSQAPFRPIAGTRTRRAESFRSLRSQTSDESPSYTASTPGYPPSSMLQSPFSAYPPPTPNTVRPGFELATALLNLDLVIMKTNRPFEQIMVAGQDVRGHHIADIAAPADNESFQAIRNRLRAERESREPAYMPPIVQSGHDPVQGVSEVEVDAYTQGFHDRTYTWSHTQLGAAAQRFPARVRLAKASTYFVVVTLPSFRPVDTTPMQPPTPTYTGPLMLGPPLQGQEAFPPSRPVGSQSVPPTAYFPYQGMPATLPSQPPAAMNQFPASRTYPPPQAMMPYDRQAYQTYPRGVPSTPRQPPAGTPYETSTFTPRSVPGENAPPSSIRGRQLPPMMSNSAAGPSGVVPMTAVHQADSADEDEGDGGLQSPRKRRRIMGIDDVLHR